MQGLQQLSLGGLASAVGMSKSGLFAHFDSKEALQLATIAEGWEIFESEVLCHSEDNTVRALSELLERWLSFSERKVFPGGCLFLHQAVEFASRPGPVNDALATAVERQVKAIEECVLNVSKPAGGDAKDATEVAFELYSIVINADALFRVQHDRVVYDHAREAIRIAVQTGSSHSRPRAARAVRTRA